MAINTCNITLKSGTDSTTLEKLVDIKDFPDLGGAPELLETTTLSDCAQTFINGVQSVDALEFTANYTKEDYQRVKADEGKELHYEIEFGENGEHGAFVWQGQHSVWVTGGGVNEVMEMVIQIAPSTAITPKEEVGA